jgi:hypothetical protein
MWFLGIKIRRDFLLVNDIVFPLAPCISYALPVESPKQGGYFEVVFVNIQLGDQFFEKHPRTASSDT